MKSLYEAPKNSHKGQNGRLLIIGGSKKYHGAAVFSILGARRFVDIIYFYPGEKDQKLINAIGAIPEVIVLEKIEEKANYDCTLFGVGLGDNKFEIEKISKLSQKIVIDGDGLKQVIKYRKKESLTNEEKVQTLLDADGEVVQRVLEFPKNCIITPHEGEFRELFGIDGSKENIERMAKKYAITILKKGPVDIVSDGKKTKENKTHNQGMTKGGTGDVLAGLVASLACKNDNFKAAFEGARICGKAGNLCKKEFGFNFCASDLAEKLARV